MRLVLNDRWLDYPPGQLLDLTVAEGELLVGRGLATEISPDEPLGPGDGDTPTAAERLSGASVPEAIAVVTAAASLDELAALQEAETSGKKRAKVLAAIDARLATLAGS